MPTSLAALLILFTAGTAAAHDYPIKPVLAVLRVEPDRVVADLDSDSIYWIEEVVGLHPLPPRDWPADARARAEKYVNERLRLSVDGKPLHGRLLEASYVQRPWEVNEQGRVRLRLSYPPVADGGTLSGEMDFFEDYRQERLAAKEALLSFMDFRGLLSIPGRVPREFELKPGSFAFSVPVADARRGAFARFLESARVGALSSLDAIEGWAALAALALSLAPGAPSRRRAALLLAAAAAGAAPWPGAAAVPLEWAAGAAAALAAGRWLGVAAVPWLEAAALAALTRAWTIQSLPLLPLSAPGALEHAGAALGLLAAAAAALAAGVAAATADRRAMDAHSQSRAPELFDRRRRLAATALLLICGCGLFATFPR
ncbi:MAG: hypothetical protein ACHQ51_06225 [Elusimicrobiota bacterium]